MCIHFGAFPSSPFLRKQTTSNECVLTILRLNFISAIRLRPRSSEWKFAVLWTSVAANCKKFAPLPSKAFLNLSIPTNRTVFKQHCCKLQGELQGRLTRVLTCFADIIFNSPIAVAPIGNQLHNTLVSTSGVLCNNYTDAGVCFHHGLKSFD